MNQESTHIVEHIINSPKAQAIVASGTVISGVDYNIMQILPQYLTVVASGLGVILTIMMIVHKYIQIKKDLKN